MCSLKYVTRISFAHSWDLVFNWNGNLKWLIHKYRISPKIVLYICWGYQGNDDCTPQGEVRSKLYNKVVLTGIARYISCWKRGTIPTHLSLGKKLRMPLLIDVRNEERKNTTDVCQIETISELTEIRIQIQHLKISLQPGELESNFTVRISPEGLHNPSRSLHMSTKVVYKAPNIRY